MSVELILIRHGESEANLGRSTDPDCALSEKGLDDARKLVSKLASFDLDSFSGVSSPYHRAKQTAEVIAAATGLAFAADDGVREWGPAATIGGRDYPRESGDELISRLADFLRRHDGRKLVVVSHASPIAVLTQLAWGEVPNTRGAFWEGVPNCCLRWMKTTCI